MVYNIRMRDDVPVPPAIHICLDTDDLTGSNKKYAGLYDKLAPFYDYPYKLYDLLTRGGGIRVRLEYLDELEVESGDHVLEVSIGTGANLRFLPLEARYTGLDISIGMLKKCQKNLRRWGRRAELFLAEAEDMPFADNVFDVVFHLGGINFFNDKAKAISEMVRVAKPGTKILIADETSNTPTFIPPTSLVPAGMREIDFQDARGKRLYQLTFRKPTN